jgi:hypothetical protein
MVIAIQVQIPTAAIFNLISMALRNLQKFPIGIAVLSFQYEAKVMSPITNKHPAIVQCVV